MKTFNEDFMQPSYSKAMAGLISVTRVTLMPNIQIFRFGSTRDPDLYFTGGWWIGFSPFWALDSYAKLRKQSLGAAARQCLAVGDWSNMDMLIHVAPREPLSAWSGTPKTQREKERSHYKKGRLVPDKDITQLYIPGLGQADPNGSGGKIWERAFRKLEEPHIIK